MWKGYELHYEDKDVTIAEILDHSANAIRVSLHSNQNNFNEEW